MNKIKVVAKIERDVKNFFFMRLFYSFSELPNNLRTVYEITDRSLLNKIINMSKSVLNGVNAFEYYPVVYNVVEKRLTEDFYIAGRVEPNTVIAGTTAEVNFDDINYFIGLISKVMMRENLGEFLVEYNGKSMSCKEFYSFQQNLSLY